MVTPLRKTLKRELRVHDQLFVLTLSPELLKLTLKGRRKGLELKWDELISGEAALAAALNASIGKLQGNTPLARRPPAPADSVHKPKPGKR